MPTRQQLVHAARTRAAKIRAVANHFRATMLDPMPFPLTQEDFASYVREVSLTSAVCEYLRAKRAEREN